MKPFFAHLSLPENVNALLFDMDGVLLDSLALDIQIITPLFGRYLNRDVSVSAEFVKSIFAYDPTKFVELILDEIERTSGPVADRAELSPKILEEYLQLRRTTPFPLLPGVQEILNEAKAKNFKRACVSNNPLAEVRNILKGAGIEGYFSEIVGNDMTVNGALLRKKPAPDTYLLAAEKLGVKPQDCAVFEDSAVGCMAGLAAGAHVVGLLTGSATLEEMRGTKPNQIFKNLTQQAA